MPVRINKRCGIPRRADRTKHAQPDIKPGVTASAGDASHGAGYLRHTCGERIRLLGYGKDVDVIKCPKCGRGVPIRLPRCRKCNTACSDIWTRDAHERDCTGVMVDAVGSGVSAAMANQIRQRHVKQTEIKRQRTDQLKKKYERAVELTRVMKERWQDPEFRQKVSAGMKAAYHRGKPKADGNQQLDSGSVAA